jgi:hypothetical protein
VVLHLLYLSELLLKFLYWWVDLNEIIRVQVEVLFVLGLKFRGDDL